MFIGEAQVLKGFIDRVSRESFQFRRKTWIWAKGEGGENLQGHEIKLLLLLVGQLLLEGATLPEQFSTGGNDPAKTQRKLLAFQNLKLHQ